MITLIAIFEATDDTAPELRQRLREMVPATRSEAGCIRYDLFEQEDDPNKYVFIETWASEGDLQRHLQMPHVRAIVADVPRLSAAPLVVYRLKSI